MAEGGNAGFGFCLIIEDGPYKIERTWRFQTGVTGNDNGFDFRYGRFQVTVGKR